MFLLYSKKIKFQRNFDKRKPPNYGGNFIFLVQRMRIELTQDTLYAPQTYASTSSATPAAKGIIDSYGLVCNKFYA